MPIDMTGGAAALANINLGNIGKDPAALSRISNSMSKLRFFSKAWNTGDQATVYYPFKWYPSGDGTSGSFEMLLAAYLGHRVSDMKILGTTFLRSLAEITMDGEVIGNGDLAYQFSQLAPLLVTAAKEQELAALNKKDWSVVGQSAFATARQQVEQKYDSKNNPKAIKPLLGRLSVYMLTEVLYVQMDTSTNGPNMGDNGRDTSTGRYIQQMSQERHTKLRKLANDPTYGIIAQNPGLVPNEKDVYFLEVLYNFTSANNVKTEAGRADPQGISQQLKLSNRFPDKEKQIQEHLNHLPTDSDAISGHTWGLAPMDEDTLRKKLQAYMFNYTDSLGCLPSEDQDRLVKCAVVIDHLRIAPTDPELKERIEGALGHPIGQAPAGDAPTLSSILDESGGVDYSKQKVSGTLVEDFQHGGAAELPGAAGSSGLGDFPPAEDEDPLAAYGGAEGDL